MNRTNRTEFSARMSHFHQSTFAVRQSTRPTVDASDYKLCLFSHHDHQRHKRLRSRLFFFLNTKNGHDALPRSFWGANFFLRSSADQSQTSVVSFRRPKNFSTKTHAHTQKPYHTIATRASLSPSPAAQSVRRGIMPHKNQTSHSTQTPSRMLQCVCQRLMLHQSPAYAQTHIYPPHRLLMLHAELLTAHVAERSPRNCFMMRRALPPREMLAAHFAERSPTICVTPKRIVAPTTQP